MRVQRFCLGCLLLLVAACTQPVPVDKRDYIGHWHGEGVLLVHGSISRALAPAFQERMQRVAQDFAQQHLADQKLPLQEREGYTVLLAMRSWEFEAFASMRRTGT